MPITSTPRNGRLRITYLADEPNLSLSGINPALTAVQFSIFANAVQTIQTGTVQDGFHIVESDLAQA